MKDLRAYAGRVPSHTLTALAEYAVDRVPPCRFIQAVLANDLMDAITLADEQNRAAIYWICLCVLNELSEHCHGSRLKVQRWLDNAARCRPAAGETVKSLRAALTGE